MSRLIVPRWAEVTALYGGTFDPPHMGHREAVFGLFFLPGVREVRVIPTGHSALKPERTPAAHRLAMAKLAFAHSSGAEPVPGPVVIDDLEIRRAQQHPGQPSYSWDTIQEMRRSIPGEKLAFVIGLDQLAQLPRWHRFPEVLTLCHWIVLARKPGGVASAASAIQALTAGGVLRSEAPRPDSPQAWSTPSGTCMTLIETPARALSSTEIREHTEKTGQFQKDALLPEIESYLKTHRLYGTTPQHDTGTQGNS